MRIGIIRDGVYYAAGTEPQRQSAPAPNVIRDDIPYLMNHADGRRYTSKRAFERAVRARGCEIIGNEMPKRVETPMDAVGPDVKTAIEQLRSR